MGRYMLDWFDFSIADEVHQLSGDTAQGNGLAVLARIAKKVITLTGTMMGGYADDLFNVLHRIDGPQLIREGFEWGGAGREMFQRKYGVIETIEKVSESENSCSRNSKKTVQILRRPGCSPMLFGNHLMNSTAFVSLEDIASELPPYQESVLEVPATGELGISYEDLAEQIKETIADYPKDKGLRSIMLNTLLCYPDHPHGWDTIYRTMYNRQSGEYVTIKVAEPANLDEDLIYPKERELINDIRLELAEGRKCQVFATYTGKHDVVGRLLEGAQRCRFPCCCAAFNGSDRQTRGMVRTPIATRRGRGDLPSAACGDWSRPAVVSNHLLLPDGIQHLHVAPGQPPFMANWAAQRCAGEVLFLR